MSELKTNEEQTLQKSASLQEFMEHTKELNACQLDLNNHIRANYLSKRELFAAMAMQGFCANPAVFATNPQNGWSLVNCDEAQLAQYSLRIADAHLSALNDLKEPT